MAQLQSLTERVLALERADTKFQAADSVLGDAITALLGRIINLEQASDSLRLAQIERDLRDIQGTQIEILKEVVGRHQKDINEIYHLAKKIKATCVMIAAKVK